MRGAEQQVPEVRGIPAVVEYLVDVHRALPARCEAKREPFAAELGVEGNLDDTVAYTRPRIDLRVGEPVRLSTCHHHERLLAVVCRDGADLHNHPSACNARRIWRIRRVIFPFIG